MARLFYYIARVKCFGECLSTMVIINEDRRGEEGGGVKLVLLIFRFSCHLVVEWKYFNATWNYVSLGLELFWYWKDYYILETKNIKISNRSFFSLLIKYSSCIVFFFYLNLYDSS